MDSKKPFAAFTFGRAERSTREVGVRGRQLPPDVAQSEGETVDRGMSDFCHPHPNVLQALLQADLQAHLPLLALHARDAENALPGVRHPRGGRIVGLSETVRRNIIALGRALRRLS